MDENVNVSSEVLLLVEMDARRIKEHLSRMARARRAGESSRHDLPHRSLLAAGTSSFGD
jgi:hypothetical protein